MTLARQALAVVSVEHDILYGRVDMIVEPDRGPTIMELELIEPNLFLRANPGSAEVFAAAIAARAARNRDHERSRS